MNKIRTQKDLESVLNKYRKRLGIDPAYKISVEVIADKNVSKGLKDAAAWLHTDETHPIYTIFVCQSTVGRYLPHPRCMIRVIVHELLHIIVGEAFSDLKKNYEYDKDGLIEETLVTRLARAIVPVSDETIV